MSYRSGFRPGLFDRQSIIVTGGGSGIGRCTAHELVSLGAHVSLVGRRREKLKRVQQEIAEAGGEADIYSCDIRDEDGVRETVANVLKARGRIDGLVCSAGGQFPAKIEDISLNGWNAVVANNLTGTFLFCKETYLQYMRDHGGAIVAIGADYDPAHPGMAHNGAARAGQGSFIASASVEWADAGVRVNLVMPGFIASSGFDEYPEAAHDTLRNITERIPMRRHGTVSETSATVTFLLSEMASYISGVTLRVDGALHNNTGNKFFRLPEPGHPTRAFDGFHLSDQPRVLGG